MKKEKEKKSSHWTRDITNLAGHFPSMHKALGSIPTRNKPMTEHSTRLQAWATMVQGIKPGAL